MDQDPWGTQVPSATSGEMPPLPTRLVDLVLLATQGESRVLEPGERWVFPSAEELPEGQALAVDGWRPLGEDPLTVLLPAGLGPEGYQGRRVRQMLGAPRTIYRGGVVTPITHSSHKPTKKAA